MPRAPSYQPNQINPAETTGARFRAADNDGGVFGALGKGLQTAGQAVGQYAEIQDKINEQYDDTQSRKLATDGATKISAITSEFTALQGGNAVTARADTEAKIAAIHDEMIGQANNPRMRRMLEERLGGLRAAYSEKIGAHAIRELGVERTATFKGQEAMYGSEAAGADDPALRDKFLLSGKAVIDDRLNFEGIRDPIARQVAHLEFTSGVHDKVLDRMFASPDPQMDEIALYSKAYGDEMMPDLRNSVLTRLQKPLQGRLDRADADVVMGLMGAGEAAPGTQSAVERTGPLAVNAEIVSFFRGRGYSEAHARGIAAGIHAESASDPDVRGGHKGRAVGIGQWLGPRRDELFRRYGTNPTMQQQLQFLDYELKGGDAGGAKVLSTKDEAGALRSYIVDFMRPAVGHETNSDLERGMKALGLSGDIGASYANAPRQWDRAQLEAALNKAAETGKWSPERIERTRGEIDKRVQRDEGLFKDRQADADDAAGQLVISMGDKFTSTNQIPNAVLKTLSPADLMKWEAVAKRNAAPKEIPANSPTAMTLNIMRFSEPEKFKTLNLGTMVGKLPNSELDTFATQQAAMRADAAKAEPAWNPRSGIVTALNYGATIGGIKLDDGDKASVMQIMEAEANAAFRAKGNKPLTETEYQDLFRSATRKIRLTGGMFGSSSEVARYELPYSAVPDSARIRITNQFKKETGKDPTEADIVRLFRVQTR